MKTKKDFQKILTEAFATPFRVSARAGGCGRVYLSLDLAKGEARAVAMACKALGLIFQTKAHYNLRNAIYVGYDNADGKALAKGEAVALALRQAGVSAYSEAFGD